MISGTMWKYRVTRVWIVACGWIAGQGILCVSHVAAQQTSYGSRSSYDGQEYHFESPENFALEFRIGPYSIDENQAVDQLFSDVGPLLAVELDVVPFRIPWVGLIGVGFGLGWADYAASATIAGSSTVSAEEHSLTLVPMSSLGVLRIDVLARKTVVPLVFTGKAGIGLTYWDLSTGAAPGESGTTLSFRWAGQVALELDFLERTAARELDEEWGINHTFLFFELFGVHSINSDAFVVGSMPAWTLGLGFVF